MVTEKMGRTDRSSSVVGA